MRARIRGLAAAPASHYFCSSAGRSDPGDRRTGSHTGHMRHPIPTDDLADAAAILAVASNVGTATHALIAYLAERFGSPTPEQVLRIGRASLHSASLGVPSRQALRAHVLSLAAVYFRDFARPGWRLVGSEVIADHDVAFDLLWERDGILEADELKTGRLRPVDLERLRRQAQAQLEAGMLEFGDAFAAVHAIVLARPSTSFVLRA